MKLEQGFLQRPEQRLILLPKMLQSIEVLQLGNVELEALVQKALTENETLELRVEGEEPAGDGRAKTSAASASRERASSRVNREASDRHQEWLANAPAPGRTLMQHLREQAALLELSAEERRLIDFVIENVDENGYLRASDEDLRAGFDGSATMEQIRAAVARVQSFDPRGVGGRGPVESLLLQLDESNPEHGLLRRLLLEFLEDISKNRLPRVARALGLELDDLRSILERLRHFNPRPGSGFGDSTAPAIRPDVIVELRDGEVEVRIEDHFLPRLGVEESYWKLSRDRGTPNEVREYLREKIDSARWLIDSIEQRRLTLARVARTVFEKQRDFLGQGARAIRPLMMKDVAEELRVHVSTISRAVAGKYVQTPQGIFPLRQFFCAAAEGESEASRFSVREMVRDLVGNEDPHHPMSDEDLVTRFQAKGIQVARRTIAKYRSELGIPSSWRRRAY